MFITDTHLLVRMEDARCSVLPRSLVSSVHIFHKVDVMEHVVAEGDHTHVRVVYRDSDGERAWTDIDASLLESSPTKLLRTIKGWHADGARLGSVSSTLMINATSGSSGSPELSPASGVIDEVPKLRGEEKVGQGLLEDCEL